MTCTGARLAAFSAMESQPSVPRDVRRYLRDEQMTPRSRIPIIGCAALAGILSACAALDAQEPPEPRSFHSQTQHGITVRIEKITVERIFNEPAWLEAIRKESKLGDTDVAEFLRQSLPPKQLTCFVSVVGDTKTLGPTEITFADNKTLKGSSARFFSPPKWQPRLPGLALDPTASGIEAQFLLSGETRISEIFPAQIQVQVTTASGKELTFAFEDVEF